MPRGVPANGRRQPRIAAVPPGTEATAEAVASENLANREFPTTVEETPSAGTPGLAEDLSGKTDDELTPEQREIKFLKDQLARSEGRKDREPEYEQVTESSGETIIIHFLEDGLTVNGRLMYRGDELEFIVGSKAYQDTFNRRGQTFLDLRHNEFAQVDRWGKIMFRNGPWPGKSYADGSFEALKAESGNGSVRPPSAEELERAEKARKRRAAPHLPSLV